MNRKNLPSILIVLLTIAGIAFTDASAKKMHSGGSPESHRGIKISRTALQAIEAVQGKDAKASRQRNNSLVRLKPSNPFVSGIKRMGATGSTIQGYMKSYDDWQSGWYELFSDGSQTLKWLYRPDDMEDEYDIREFPFNCGFLRNGVVYGIESSVFFGYAIIGHGKFTLDGKILESEEDLYEDFSRYTFSCAYDADADVAYAYTINSDGTAYMFQKIDPESWDYTVINDNVAYEDLCVAFTWCVEDGKLYGVTTEGKFVTVAADGSPDRIFDMKFPETNATCGFTYSPIDHSFALVNSADYISTLYIIGYPDFAVHNSVELYDVFQYTILICPDDKPDPQAPRTPVIDYIQFTDASSTGNVALTFPSFRFDGSELTSALTMECMIDGETAKTLQAEPGSSVSFSLENVAEGMRTISFVCKSDDHVSPAAEREIYVGYDTPLAPENVAIESGVISWDPYPEDGVGIHGGYIDIENLTFNVYLNDEKVNNAPVSGTSFSFETPDVDYTLFVAGVEAVNHGHESTIARSANGMPGGNGQTLPQYYGPDAEQASLFIIQPEYSWFYSMYDGCFMTDTYGDGEDHWLISPKLHFSDNKKLAVLSFEALPNTNEPETIAVYLMDSTDTSEALEIKQLRLTDNTDFTLKSLKFAVPDEADYYIGIKVTTQSNGGILGLRNISIAMTETPAEVPAECTGISAQAYPKGELKADVTFTLPLTDACGTPLPATEKLKAIAKSPAGESSADGLPGEEVKLPVATSQGFNDISVSANSTKGEGLSCDIRVFTGIDVPSPITSVTTSSGVDNNSVTLSWDAPATGINGGYITPELITYALCRINEEGYAYIDTEIGNATSYTYTEPQLSDLHICELGILPQSEGGNSGLVRFVSVDIGRPYDMPMNETFSANPTEENGYSYSVYNPVIGQVPSEDYGECLGIGYLGYLPDSPIEGFGIYGYAPGSGDRGRIELPKFSTAGSYKAAIELTVYGGQSVGDIELMARYYGTSYTKFGEIKGNGHTGWKRFRFMLPDDFNGREWVQIALDAVFDAPEEEIGVSRYIISEVPDHDLSITKNLTYANAQAGFPVTLAVEISNQGMLDMNLPELLVEISRDGEPVDLVRIKPETPSTLKPLESAVVSGEWIPGGDAIGDVDVRFTIASNDESETNNCITTTISISKGNKAVIDDLKAEDSNNGNSIILTWSEPKIESGFEGFENYNAFTVLNHYGDFRNFDGDGENESYFSLFNLPCQWDPKAWQVIGTEEVSAIIEEEAGEANTYFYAASGDKFAASFTPYAPLSNSGLYAANWLISPRLLPASDFSFRLSNLAGYADVVTVKVSEDGETFTDLDIINLSSGKWNLYEYTLPAGATHFAIVGSSEPDYGFVVLLDDITFVPADGAEKVVGYDIYRNSVMIAENADVHGSWTDTTESSVESSATYYIVPVISRNGTNARGIPSNNASIGNSGVSEINLGLVSVYGLDSGIIITGAVGKKCRIFTPSGIVATTMQVDSDRTFYQLSPGIYIIEISGINYKVMVF